MNFPNRLPHRIHTIAPLSKPENSSIYSANLSNIQMLASRFAVGKDEDSTDPALMR
jgi:hypothetical protein